MRIRNPLKLDAELGTRDKVKILVAYALTILTASALVLLLVWAMWPYDRVTWEGETFWTEDTVPVVERGELAELAFIVPSACNSRGYSLDFQRVVQSGPRTPNGTFFRWQLNGNQIINPTNTPFCDTEIEVRVVFPVLYPPGEYTLEWSSTYYPNPLFPRSVPFSSPTFEIVDNVPGVQ